MTQTVRGKIKELVETYEYDGVLLSSDDVASNILTTISEEIEEKKKPIIQRVMGCQHSSPEFYWNQALSDIQSLLKGNYEKEKTS
jgi:hypothetical protein